MGNKNEGEAMVGGDDRTKIEEKLWETKMKKKLWLEVTPETKMDEMRMEPKLKVLAGIWKSLRKCRNITRIIGYITHIILGLRHLGTSLGTIVMIMDRKIMNKSLIT
jgi:hypothetical protein